MKPGNTSHTPRTNGLQPPFTYSVLFTFAFSAAFLVLTTLFYTASYSLPFTSAGICINLLLLIPLGLAIGVDPTDPISRCAKEMKHHEMFCVYCDTTVDPTSKHCKVCDRCVHGFDHHCKWLNTCVGTANYSYFFATISYFTFLMAFNGSQCILEINDHYPSPPTVTCIFLALNALPFIPMSHLLTFHLYLIWTGKTTYECITARRRKVKPGLETSDKYRVPLI